MSLWLDKLVEVWFDESKPLLDAAFDISAAFSDIAKDLLVP